MADHNLVSLLTETILPEMRRMSYGSAQYLAYGQIAVGIELFGACADADPFDTERVSRRRFELGITRYMAPVDARYPRYIGCKNPYDLYTHLRCGMAHLLRPQGKVGFTSRGDTLKDGTQHLEVYAPRNLLVLVIEDFFDHFQVATKAFIADLPNLDQTKVAGVFLPVHDPAPAPVEIAAPEPSGVP